MLKKISQKLIYRDPWLEFFQDQVEFPDGATGTYAWAKRKNGVGVVVMTPDRRVLLHREFRYVVQKYSWEVQGGGIDEGETAAHAAVRELAEEVGLIVPESALKPLGACYPLHSFNTELVTLFALIAPAQELDSSHTESSEAIDHAQYVSFTRALEMIDTGEINDAATSHALQMAIRRFEELKKE